MLGPALNGSMPHAEGSLKRFGKPVGEVDVFTNYHVFLDAGLLWSGKMLEK